MIVFNSSWLHFKLLCASKRVSVVVFTAPTTATTTAAAAAAAATVATVNA